MFDGGEKVVPANETKKILDNNGNLIPLYSKAVMPESYARFSNAYENVFDKSDIQGISSIKKAMTSMPNISPTEVNIVQNINANFPNITNASGYENFAKFMTTLYSDSLQYAARRR